MYTYEEQCTINLGDGYTLLYSFIIRRMLDSFGLEGERAAREATRRFGRDRALTTRARHEKLGAKINMKSLFSIGGDLPPDPRFRRELQELNPQERVSHTLICPMADMWKQYGEQAIGRIYCEEFHNSCYGTYAFGYTKVYLAKTLTQDGDEYCAFNIVLRPENLPDELKPQCFAEYDPDYHEVKYERKAADGKTGFDHLSIKLYYYLLDEAVKAFGDEGARAVEAGLEDAGRDAARRIASTAKECGKELDAAFFSQNVPFEMDPESDPLWADYLENNARQRAKEHFVETLKAEIKALTERDLAPV